MYISDSVRGLRVDGEGGGAVVGPAAAHGRVRQQNITGKKERKSANLPILLKSRDAVS